MTSPETDCASDCCQDADCPCVKVCDETYCGRHHAEEAKKWAAYFGLREGMTREERRAQLEAFRPVRSVSFTKWRGLPYTLPEESTKEDRAADWADRANDEAALEDKP